MKGKHFWEKDDSQDRSQMYWLTLVHIGIGSRWLTLAHIGSHLACLAASSVLGTDRTQFAALPCSASWASAGFGSAPVPISAFSGVAIVTASDSVFPGSVGKSASVCEFFVLFVSVTPSASVVAWPAMPRQWHARKHARWTFPAYFNWRIWLILSLLMSFQPFIAFPIPLKFTSTPNDQWRPGQVVAFVEQKIDPGHQAPEISSSHRFATDGEKEQHASISFGLSTADMLSPSLQRTFVIVEGWSFLNSMELDGIHTSHNKSQHWSANAGFCRRNVQKLPLLAARTTFGPGQRYTNFWYAAYAAYAIGLCSLSQKLFAKSAVPSGSMSFDSFFTSNKNYVTTFRGCRREGCAISNHFFCRVKIVKSTSSKWR